MKEAAMRNQLAVAERLGLPTIVKHGDYTATLEAIEQSNDLVAYESARWIIRREDLVVGKMFDGRTYGWGRPHCSMTELLWSGPLPEDCADSRSPHYGIHFDTGPEDSHEAALARFAKNADRLTAWRRKQQGKVTL